MKNDLQPKWHYNYLLHVVSGMFGICGLILLIDILSRSGKIKDE